MAETIHESRLLTEAGVDQRITEIIEPVMTGMGYVLVRVRLSSQNGITLQVMAEREDGIMTVEDCEAVSMAISPVIDLEDPVDKAYHLEVSSPGIDPPMVRKSDFTRWQGHLVKIETSILVENRKRFSSKIFETDADGFKLKRDQIAYGDKPTVIIPFSALSDAKLILTDDLIRDARRADKAAKIAAANQKQTKNNTM